MSSSLLFKQYNGDRHTGIEINNLCWNSKLDLLAISNVKGEIILQRLFWKKAWEYPCPFETCSVLKMCWSPNGDCLVVVYSNFFAHFLELENGKLVHEIKLTPAVEIVVVKWRDISQNNKTNKEPLQFRDLLAEFPPWEKVSVSKSGNGATSFTSTFLRDNIQLSLLLFGNSNGTISLYLNGYFYFATIDIGCELTNLINFDFSNDFNHLCIGYVDSVSENTKCTVLNSKNFTSKIDEFNNLTHRVGSLMASWQYLESVIKRINDSWEDLLIDVSDKFTKFAKEKWLSDKNSTVGDELIIVAAFGTASPELQSFLTNDLTEKSLKKLIQTLETNYQTLRRLLFSNLNIALSAAFYHITQLREFNNQIEPTCQLIAQNSCASTCLKAREMYNVVDYSLTQLGAFFNWLQKVLLSITEENVPPTSSGRQQSSNFDINLVTNFIEENFVKVYNENDSPLFPLEKVGQYLKNENLQTTVQCRSPVFDAVSNLSREDVHIYKLNKNSSLIQEVNRLKQTIDEMLSNIPERNKNLFVNNASVVVFDKTSVASPTDIQIIHRDSEVFRYFLVCKTPAIGGLHVVDVDVKCRILRNFDLYSSYNIVDMSYYSPTFMTLLLESNNTSSETYRLVQLNEALFSTEPFIERRTIRLDESSSVSLGARVFSKVFKMEMLGFYVK